MICPFCEAKMQCLLDMPRFPVTEKYEPWEPMFVEGRGLFDQSFHFCEVCTHGMLGRVVPGLYGEGYRTTTAHSEGARKAVDNFAWYIHSLVMGSFDVVIDIGANDSTLLEMFDMERVAVDPNARGNALCIRETIETADLSKWANRNKLIVSSHTIEHVERPEVLIGKAAQMMRGNDYLALQFPSLELLVEDARIDQIHHQHIHYFSERSITKLLYRHGLEVVAAKFDDSHWGAFMVIARRGVGEIAGEKIQSIDVENAIRTFTNYSVHVPQGSIALGAALMLPVLAYWFPELDAVSFIADDDPTKNGLRYINFNKPIGNYYNLCAENVVITAVGSKSAARALTKKAIDAGAKRIILPIPTL